MSNKPSALESKHAKDLAFDSQDARDYIDRKREEKSDKDYEHSYRVSNRAKECGDKSYPSSQKDTDRAKVVKEIVDKKFGKDTSADNAQKKYNKSVAYDATNRHIRRHSKNEAAIELAESLLESYQPDCIFC